MNHQGGILDAVLAVFFFDLNPLSQDIQFASRELVEWATSCGGYDAGSLEVSDIDDALVHLIKSENLWVIFN